MQSSARSESADSYIANDVRMILECHVCLFRFIALRRAKCRRHLMTVVCTVRCKLACISNAQRAAIETRRVPAKGCFSGFCLQDTRRMAFASRKFSRHGIAQASLALLIWLNENCSCDSWSTIICVICAICGSQDIHTPHGLYSLDSCDSWLNT